MGKLERDFQSKLIKDIRGMLPGAIVLKNDARQGMPDVLVLFEDKWAAVECKKEKPKSSADFQPNQEYYIERMNEMSYAAVAYPENREEVLNGIQRSLRPTRSTRVSKRV